MLPTLKEYYQALKAHDWHWYMSDDRSVRNKGQAQERCLSKVADESEIHGVLFDAFEEHYWARIRGTEIPALPKEPENENNE